MLLLNDSSSAAARILHPLVRRSSIAVVRHCQKLTHQLENLNGKLFGMCKPCHALNRAVSMDQIVKIERRVATEPAALISWMLDDKRCRRVKVAQSCAGPAGCSWPYRHSLRSCCRRESGKELPRAEARARSSEVIRLGQGAASAHFRSSRISALARIRSLRITAVMASLAGFPALQSRW